MPERVHDFFAPPLPRVIAHQGLGVEAPENTLLAFLKALSAGATHLETDVRASADGVAVVAHDEDLARVAGRDIRVDQLTMAELRRVDLGHGQGFCSLAEMLDAFPDALVNIDVKADDAVVPAVAALKDARAERRVLVTSFDEKRRRAALERLDGVVTSASSGIMTRTLAALRLGRVSMVRRALAGVHAVQVPERFGVLPIVTARNVHLLQDAGVEVHVWTVNERDDMERLLDLGVDGLVTDRTDVAVEVISARGKR